jgi:hypothetical protein
MMVKIQDLASKHKLLSSSAPYVHFPGTASSTGVGSADAGSKEAQLGSTGSAGALGAKVGWAAAKARKIPACMMFAWQQWVIGARDAIARIFRPDVFAGLQVTVQDHEDAVMTLEGLKVQTGLEKVCWIPAETLVHLGRRDLKRIGPASPPVNEEFGLFRSTGSAGAAGEAEASGRTGPAGSPTHPPTPGILHPALARISLFTDSTEKISISLVASTMPWVRVIPDSC